MLEAILECNEKAFRSPFDKLRANGRHNHTPHRCTFLWACRSIKQAIATLPRIER